MTELEDQLDALLERLANEDDWFVAIGLTDEIAELRERIKDRADYPREEQT